MRNKFVMMGIAAVYTMSLLSAGAVHAAPSPQSAHYRLDETAVGTSGYLDSKSSNYSATSGAGALATGSSASSNFQATSGTRTSPDPVLSFAITNGNLDFGSFSAATTSTATAKFAVTNYTSYGYTVQILGTPPTNGSRTLPGLATATAPTPGTEQFGLNLVANTIPSSVGANPVNDQFGFGSATDNYGTSNKYRFVNGETIAQSAKSSGVTTYTITYIANVASLTPGGKYSSSQTLLVTGTY